MFQNLNKTNILQNDQKNFFIIGTEHTAELHKDFCLNANPLFFEKHYTDFIPDKDYDYRYFKLINEHYLNYIAEKYKQNAYKKFCTYFGKELRIKN